MPELKDVLASGDISEIKKGGISDGREVQTVEEVAALLVDGTIDSIFKGGDTAEKEVLNKEEIEALNPPLLFFAGNSLSTISISTDPDAPSFFPIDNDFQGQECELYNATNGEIRNLSGRTIDVVTGTFSFTPQKDGAGTTILYIVSERSTDGGVTWTPNIESLRTFELQRDINQFGTKLSMLFNWLPNEIVRFKAYSSSTLDLVSQTETIDGDDYASYSWFWTLAETL